MGFFVIEESLNWKVDLTIKFEFWSYKIKGKKKWESGRLKMIRELEFWESEYNIEEENERSGEYK